MFENEAPADFSLAATRAVYSEALQALNERLGAGPLIVKPIVAGKEIDCSETFIRYDPSESSTAVSKIFLADEKLAGQSIELVSGAAPLWRQTPAEKRCEIIKSAAQIMRQKRLELFALIVREAGKAWKESEADVCEAIDFLDFYAEEMLRLSAPHKTDNIPGEDNYHSYKAKGVCAVLPPWNFPLAIACGMTAAALVTGNAAIVKPARQSSAIAAELVKILLQAGVPADVLAFLPGPGPVIGRLLVKDPRVHICAFTGSREVGLEIIERAASLQPGQKHVKRVIAEMGGKNAIIVDEDADPDEAVKGIIYSAFGFSGQKCSACSRLIVVGSAYQPLLNRLKDAAADIIVGKSCEPSTLLGPVIDQEAQKRILDIISKSEAQHKLLVKGKVPENGCFVPACIFYDVDPESEIWKEEIFGPVLACLQAESFDHALRLANNSQYALTAGLYSRSPVNIQMAKDNIEVGNFYINRPCTGAIVRRHPFGGFKLSGIGSKAGGTDYLLQFLEPRLVSENTMRRGFAPE